MLPVEHARRTPLTAVLSARAGMYLPLLVGVLVTLGAAFGGSITSPTHLLLVAAVGATGLGAAGVALLVAVVAALVAALPMAGPPPSAHPGAPRAPSRQQDPTAAGRPHPRAPGAMTLPRVAQIA